MAKRAPAAKSIFIVDDHPVLRRGLTALINAEPDLDVCGEAASLNGSLEAIPCAQPDLVIVDVALRNEDGLSLVKHMHTEHPEVPTLVLSMHDEAVYAERSLRAGARGYVSKQQLDQTLLNAIRCVLEGETYMSDKLRARLAEKCLEGKRVPEDTPLNALSDRELQVFRLLGEGHGTREIADELGISVKTVESHCAHIKNKLTIDGATELAHRATLWVANGDTPR